MTKTLERKLRTAARLAYREMKRNHLYAQYDNAYRLASALRKVVNDGNLPDGATKAYLAASDAELRDARSQMFTGYANYRTRMEALATLLGVR